MKENVLTDGKFCISMRDDIQFSEFSSTSRESLAPISCLRKGLSKITPSLHSSFYGIINVTHSEKIAVGNLLVWPL